MAAVEMKAVRKAFGAVEIIRGVDLSIDDGEFTVFVGPSGCGKSTLLRMIAGLEDISSGQLLIGGELANQLAPARRGVAMVFQSYALYPHMTVYENMAFGLSLARQDAQQIRASVLQAASILQLSQLLERKPRELSGGQRQRVAIGRAIVRKPRVFLFDEPLSNLDAALRVQMRIEIARLHADLGATMIYVTHDQVEAMTLADRIVVLNRGNVEQHGTPLELYHRPRNRFVGGFIGSPRMNFIAGRIAGLAPGALTVGLPGGTSARVDVQPGSATAGDTVSLGIRPEHLVVTTPDQAGILGKVQVIERLGDETYAYLEVAGAEDGLLTLRLDPDVPVAVGQQIPLAIPSSQAHLFDQQGLAFIHAPGREDFLAVAGSPRAQAHR